TAGQATARSWQRAARRAGRPMDRVGSFCVAGGPRRGLAGDSSAPFGFGFGGYGGHGGGSPGRGTGRARVGGPAVHTRLALAAGAGRLSLVSHHATLPPTAPGGLARCVRADR